MPRTGLRDAMTRGVLTRIPSHAWRVNCAGGPSLGLVPEV